MVDNVPLWPTKRWFVRTFARYCIASAIGAGVFLAGAYLFSLLA